GAAAPERRRAVRGHRHRAGGRRRRRAAVCGRPGALRRPAHARQGVALGRRREAGGDVPMKWPALVLAGGGRSVSGAAGGVSHSFDVYCGFPGRCSWINDGGGEPVKIAQSTARRLVISGSHLSQAKTVDMTPDDAGTATLVDASETEILVDLTLVPGLTIGSP